MNTESPRSNEADQEKLYGIIGCLVRSEREFLLRFAADQYRGDGEIVDLGSFLGSSTLPLAIGLEQNQQVAAKDGRIHAFDMFVWQPWMRRPARGTYLENKPEGESFLEDFKRQMGRWLSMVQVYPGDLTKLTWNRELAIEYLMVDAMKSWELCNAIHRQFYPCLVPGMSLLHQQDYVWFGVPWIHLAMYRMREFFEPLEHGYMNASRVFRYTKQLPEAMINAEYSIDAFSVDEIDDAFRYAFEITDPQGQPRIEAAHVMCLIEARQIERALEKYATMTRENAEVFERPEFERLRTIVSEYLDSDQRRAG